VTVRSGCKTGTRQNALSVYISIPESKRELACGILAHSESGYFRFSYDADFPERSRRFALGPHYFNLPESASWCEHPPHVLLDTEAGAWGQKIQIHAELPLSELTLKFPPATERIGAITFGVPEERVSAPDLHLDLEACLALSQRMETCPSPEYAQALAPVTAGVNGSRPKALVQANCGEYAIAKFPSPSDAWPVINCEFLGMRLAQAAGLTTSNVRLIDVNGSDVLLIDRFDVIVNGAGRKKRHIFSALTALQLLDWEARYAGYPEFADFLSRYSHTPKDDCRELYARMVLNMLVGNTDDHARNHAVFWDGSSCRLTPVYDVVMFPRVGTVSSQAMIVGKEGTISSRQNSLSECHRFGLTSREASEIHDQLAEAVSSHWERAADEAKLPKRYREQLKRQIADRCHDK